MPLSKKRQAEYQKERRLRVKLGRTQSIVIPAGIFGGYISEDPTIKEPASRPELDADGNQIPDYC